MQRVEGSEKRDLSDDFTLTFDDSELSPQAWIWHGAYALDRRAAIIPKLLISALCWIAIFLQQIDAAMPGAFSRDAVHHERQGAAEILFDHGFHGMHGCHFEILQILVEDNQRADGIVSEIPPASHIRAFRAIRGSIFICYTRTTGGPDPGVKLMAVLADHLGSTDVIVTGKWNTSTAAFANITTERQSFDAWGERRAADTQVNYRATDSDAFRTSAQEHHRGYTGHEQLDDSGLIHMNGRIYDPELGRFLSPDPYVQIPEYSQNFNRYSYVLNNPLNATDPSGFSFLSKFFSKVGSWIKENWRTIFQVVVNVVLQIFQVPAPYAAAIASAFTTAISGGSGGDIARSAAVAFGQSYITGGLDGKNGLESVANQYLYVAGHSVVGGAANVAMGGKFQDGFLASFANSIVVSNGFYNSGNITTNTVKTFVVGGTASAIGGGKFANGGVTAAFQYLASSAVGNFQKNSDFNNEDRIARKYANEVYNESKGGLLQTIGYSYKDNIFGFGAYLGKANGQYVLAFRGTNPETLTDWITNIGQALGYRGSQYQQAGEIALFVKAKLGSEVLITGHSLGGGLATFAASVSGLRATTFNAAGLNPLVGSRNAFIRSHYIRGDILTTAQDILNIIPTAVGNRIYHNPTRIRTPIGYHFMDNFSGL